MADVDPGVLSWASAQHKAWVLSLLLITQLKAFNFSALIIEKGTGMGNRPLWVQENNKMGAGSTAVTESFCARTHRSPM